MSKIDYSEKIKSLTERKEKLLEQKQKIDNELKAVDMKLKEYEKAQIMKDIDKTVIVLKKTGISMKDVVKAINSGNLAEIQNKLATINAKEEEEKGNVAMDDGV